MEPINRIILIAASVLLIICLGIAAYIFFINPDIFAPKKPKDELVRLLTKEKPNFLGQYTVTLGIPIFGSKQNEFEFWADWYYFTKDRQKWLIDVEFFGSRIETEVYLLNKKQVLCTKSTSLFITYSEQKCELLDNNKNNQSWWSKFEKLYSDLNMSFDKDREIAGLTSICFRLTGTSRDFNLDSLLKASFIGEHNEETRVKKSLPTGFTLFPLNYRQEEIKNLAVDMIICTDKAHGILTLLDLNFTYKPEQARRGSTLTFRIKLDKAEFDKVKKSDVTVPIPFSFTYIDCEKQKVSFNISSFRDLSGKAKLIVYKSGLMAEEKKKETERSLGDITLSELEKYDFNVLLPKPLEDGKKQIEFCVDNQCQSTHCYSYTPKSFFASADCYPDKVKVVLTPQKDIAGDVNITLYKREYGGETYTFKKIVIANKIFPNSKMEKYKSKTFFLEPTEELERGSYDLDICIDSECDSAFCFVHAYSSPTPSPTPTPQQADLNAKVEECTTKISDEVAQAKCLSAVFTNYKQNVEVGKSFKVLCDKLKLLVWKNKDIIGKTEGGGYTYIYFYNVPDCYAYYAYYNNLTDSVCDELSGYVVNYNTFTLNWEERCKETLATLIAQS